MRFTDLPRIQQALELMFEHDLNVAIVSRIEIPSDWEDKVRQANEALEFINGQQIYELVDQSRIDQRICQPDDDAFEYVCTGDSAMLDLVLVTVPHAGVLKEVLESLMEGDLHEVLEMADDDAVQTD